MSQLDITGVVYRKDMSKKNHNSDNSLKDSIRTTSLKVLCVSCCIFVFDGQILCVLCCRCVAALTSLGGLVAGAVLWPALADSLSHTYKILPGEMVLAGILHNVQLIVSIEIPTLYMALEVSMYLIFI